MKMFSFEEQMMTYFCLSSFDGSAQMTNETDKSYKRQQRQQWKKCGWEGVYNCKDPAQTSQ